MTKSYHRIYILILTLTVVAVFFILGIFGADYYFSGAEERFLHAKNGLLKPSGLIGHGVGIAGSLFMLIGVIVYMARKRIRMFSRVGVLKYWLEFHIFLCTLGPVLVLYHTSFKFGGIVAVSFWSMVAVVFSGVIGRFIYLQIPRTIEGRVMNLSELNEMEGDLYAALKDQYSIDYEVLLQINQALVNTGQTTGKNFLIRILKRLRFERKLIGRIKQELKTQQLTRHNFRKVVKIFKSRIILHRRIDWLSSMQNFLRYWHVAHLPFALIMLVIVIIHIVVAILFGYKWIF